MVANVNNNEIINCSIQHFECCVLPRMTKEEREKVLDVVKFTKQEITDMFYAVEHGGIIIFDCEWRYADNANTKYKVIACDRPRALRIFLKHTHHMRMDYKIVFL